MIQPVKEFQGAKLVNGLYQEQCSIEIKFKNKTNLLHCSLINQWTLWNMDGQNYDH